MPLKYIKITISSSKPGRYAQNGTVYIEIAMETMHAHVRMHGESPRIRLDAPAKSRTPHVHKSGLLFPIFRQIGVAY